MIIFSSRERIVTFAMAKIDTVSQDSAAGVAALWAMQPEEAEAFRQDRIFNAKQTLVPKIRNLVGSSR